MIAYLKGTLFQKSPNQAILDINGVCYSASIPLSTYLTLGNIGDFTELSIYTHMTDNSLSLYGFSSEDEKEIFLKLIENGRRPFNDLL